MTLKFKSLFNLKKDIYLIYKILFEYSTFSIALSNSLFTSLRSILRCYILGKNSANIIRIYMKYI
ncbi:hypothetical protein BpHYR1_025692 [Brachionus plicatilis]|uniref:Uncharacterized protein n=1 Tax=Brachionus plicatilis TaxID=10195 RepID=A0A3M7SHG2_BRAPC|nr:hypothetical protein BpHYR1_025692 [Brachionus plicatilis]